MRLSAHVIPRCPHFGPCGGCLWQDLDYPAQLRAKQAIVVESLRPLGGPERIDVRSIIGGEPWYYRNKMEFAFQPPGRLGLHRRGRWDEIEDLRTCFLQSPRTVDLLTEVREFVRAHGLSCYDPRTHQGLLRHLIVREGKATGELLVAVVTATDRFPQVGELARVLAARHPELTGFLWAANPSKGDAVSVRGVEVVYGRPYIVERLRGFTFKLGLLTFFQTNTAQAERMIDLVGEFAALRGDEHILDLFCGVGTFALALAAQAQEVIGIEAVPAAVEAARENAALNGVTNARFETADARHVEQTLAAGTWPDVLVLDPPRAGAGPRLMQAIGRLAPRRVIYISCNLATLVPDLRALLPAGYEVGAVQPIDLFPQTDHVECVVLLERVTAS